MSAESKTKVVRICKTDDERQVVYGVVYAPWEIDTHGEMMTKEDVEEMAHKFLSSPTLTSAIDTNHDNVSNGSYPIESFIARKDDPDGYPEGSWVLGTKIVDEEIWKAVKSGEINGYSVEALVYKVEAEVEVAIIPHNVGLTEKSDDHTHTFFVELDTAGKVVAGKTDEVDGHSHTISKASATDTANGHSHRFFLS